MKARSFSILLATIYYSISTLQAADTTPDKLPEAEPAYAGWSLSIDNDLFTGGDRDYTGGLVLSVNGAATRDWLFSLDDARALLTRISGFQRFFRNEPHLTRHTIDFGFALFTPSDLTIAEPIDDDRPYASLFFITNAAQYVLPERLLSFQSVLTVALLGLPLADTIQSGLHRAIDTPLPQGWDNQISEGGEPTARFSLGVQKTLLKGGGPGLSTQLLVNSELNVGFTTDTNLGFGMRWGRLVRPWHTFNPHPAEYISVGTPPDKRNPTGGKRELYLNAGANIKYRLYNALLQGQFRDSELRFDHDELNSLIIEGWIGFQAEMGKGFRLGGFVRSRTAELDKSIARSPTWAGIIVSRSL